MLVHDYSNALFDLLQKKGEGDNVFASLKSLLHKKGHSKLYPQILKELLKKFNKNTAQSTTRVVVSRASDLTTLESSILSAINTLSAEKKFTTEIDPTLIGGFKIIGHDQVIDQSYKKQLLTIYRSLIA